MSSSITIDTLPSETIGHIVQYLHHLEDFLALCLTCRHLNTFLRACAPSDLLALCYRSRATFFRPNPHFLLSALIPAIREYTCSSQMRRSEVKRAIWHGCESLLEWACHTPAIVVYTHWSLDSIRELWEWRMRVLNPLSDLVDRCIGVQWSRTPDFWDGGVEDANTLTAEPEKQVFQLQMYGDMFGELMCTYLERGRESPHVDKDIRTDGQVRALSVSLRLDFVKYLLPDGLVRWYAQLQDQVITSAAPASPTDYFVSHDLPTTVACRARVHPLRAVQNALGPYAPYQDSGWEESQSALLHLLRSSPLWTTLVRVITARCGGEFHTPQQLVLADDQEGAVGDPTFEPPSSEEGSTMNDADADDHIEPDAGHSVADGTIEENMPHPAPEEQDGGPTSDGDSEYSPSDASSLSEFIPPTRYTADADDGHLTPTQRTPELWKQDMWDACLYALGSEFFEMMAEVWRVHGPQEVALLGMRRVARMRDRDRHEGEADDDAVNDRPMVVVESQRLDVMEKGDGWDTLRRWRQTIAELDKEPKRVMVGMCVTHEEYPDMVGDMLVATCSVHGRS